MTTRKLSHIWITLAAVAVAGVISLIFYSHYQAKPWTRDGQVRANIVGIAPRVAGPVVQIPIKDNQTVKKGDLLFEIDPATYSAAVANARAQMSQAEAELKKNRQEFTRQTELMQSGATDLRTLQNAQDDTAAAQADVDASVAALTTAELNLSYTKVTAPVDGYLTNVNTSLGTYVQAGDQLLTLVDAASFWVAAYFKETQLHAIKTGGKTKIVFMGYPWQPCEGVVESIGWGIFLEDGSTVEMLPQISQTVDWIRLPNRFPVRVQITGTPPAELRIGQTVSVSVE